MQQTNNYGLNQWELTDLIKMEDFNGDNSKVDAALKTLAGQVAGKASSSTVSSLSAAVNAKAAQSDLTAAVNRITALESGKADKTALTAEQTARENADNAEKAAREAADTALGARVDALVPKAGVQLLKTVGLEESISEFTVPLDDIDWSQWKAVHVLFDITSTYSSQAEVLINSNTIAYVYGNNLTDRSQHSNFGHLIFYPMFDSRMKVELISLQEGKVTATGYQYQNFTQFRVKFGSSEKAFPGTEITVWGEK
ncbi:hypothetical protein [Oscillibacter sp.]|uniref:hypothetical protein n=1 Tax=Oscillibacter sp. TaxID=1945593 RepID=UPI001B746E04|nr:hypothetical protein [Oscillibacter sp.]MBP3509465.1 hypothetical protein [Oscillibacter sp.]